MPADPPKTSPRPRRKGWVTVEEIADRTGKSTRTVSRWLRSQAPRDPAKPYLPSSKLAGRRQVPEDRLARFCERWCIPLAASSADGAA